MTTHQVDLMRWVMGEVVSVSAVYSFDRLFQGEPDVTVPDSQAVLLRFASGASATVNTACAVSKGGQGRLDFLIRDAVVSWKGDAITVEPEGSYVHTPSPADGLTIDAAFVKAVATGDSSLLRSPYEDGIKSAAVTLAANRSAEEGGRLVHLEEMLG
jgi:predicted dehydrogenase